MHLPLQEYLWYYEFEQFIIIFDLAEFLLGWTAFDMFDWFGDRGLFFVVDEGELESVELWFISTKDLAHCFFFIF